MPLSSPLLLYDKKSLIDTTLSLSLSLSLSLCAPHYVSTLAVIIPPADGTLSTGSHDSVPVLSPDPPCDAASLSRKLNSLVLDGNITAHTTTTSRTSLWSSCRLTESKAVRKERGSGGGRIPVMKLTSQRGHCELTLVSLWYHTVSLVWAHHDLKLKPHHKFTVISYLWHHCMMSLWACGEASVWGHGELTSGSQVWAQWPRCDVNFITISDEIGIFQFIKLNLS